MTKTALIKEVTNKGKFKKRDTERFFKTMEDVVTQALLDGERVYVYPGIVFEVVDVKERKCRNPRTGESVIVPEHQKLRVKVKKKAQEFLDE